MQRVTILTSPVDTDQDLEDAKEQLREISNYGASVLASEYSSNSRQATITLNVPNREVFESQLKSSKFVSLYTMVKE